MEDEQRLRPPDQRDDVFEAVQTRQPTYDGGPTGRLASTHSRPRVLALSAFQEHYLVA
jgi:hypothetical protein